jgi:hypothetical protein
MFGAGDISIFFQDGPLCTVIETNQQAHVCLDFPEELNDFGGKSKPGVVQGKPTLQFATGSLALANGTIVDVAGTQYKVAYVRKIDDGLVSVADLNKP